jgi:hypothetical protein
MWLWKWYSQEFPEAPANHCTRVPARKVDRSELGKELHTDIPMDFDREKEDSWTIGIAIGVESDLDPAKRWPFLLASDHLPLDQR